MVIALYIATRISTTDVNVDRKYIAGISLTPQSVSLGMCVSLEVSPHVYIYYSSSNSDKCFLRYFIPRNLFPAGGLSHQKMVPRTDFGRKFAKTGPPGTKLEL